MHYTSDRLATHQRATSWLLVVLLLSCMLFPLHYHFHHHEDTGHAGEITGHHIDHHVAGDHVTEAHNGLELFGSGHEDGSHTIEPVSDPKMKSTSYQLVLVFLVISLVLLPLLPVRALSCSLEDIAQKLACLHWYYSPPQRAPPVL